MKSFTKMVAVAGVMFALGASTSLAHADSAREAANECVCAPVTASDASSAAKDVADEEARRAFIQQIWTAP